LFIPIKLDWVKEPAQIVVVDAAVLSGIWVQSRAELGERGY
jgi:hypothetical protein